ncbi:MAG: hypothetical protein KDA87_03885 [Planctomycetales bacterium]|nr:hypothetical protein [Planctomycetales bacterium]
MNTEPDDSTDGYDLLCQKYAVVSVSRFFLFVFVLLMALCLILKGNWYETFR